MRHKIEVVAYIGLGALLGLGIAAYRGGVFAPTAEAQTAAVQKGNPKEAKKEQPSGIFSPPGTSDTGPVTPPTGRAAFQG